jgi:Ferritin-like
MKTIQDHLSIAPEKRDYAWITSALQIAIELEHATLPLYLSAMFAHKVQNYPSYNLFRSIVMEEMVHMAISCNVLAFIGGTPQIKNLSPAFPGKGLPGGAEPDVETVVATFSKTQLQNFMRIEMPNFLLPDEYKTETYPTISKLYTAIQDAIQLNADAVRAAIKKGATSNQVGDDIGFTTFTYTEGTDPLPQLFAGFQEIIEQGEGNEDETLHAGPTSQEELSHYGRFAEIYLGHEYQKPANPTNITPANLFEFFAGAPVQFPDVVNTLLVPSDGYAKILALDPNGPAVQKTLLNFDTTYTTIMSDLENMWNGPANESWPKFGDAVGKMAEMRVLSCFYIMQNQIPADVIKKLENLYPTEYASMQKYTNLNEPVFYGPRFFNLNPNN